MFLILQVKEIEKRDSVLTPKQQIDRLLRPGSSYFNLNPFEVLQIDPDTVIDEIKKKYRRVGIILLLIVYGGCICVYIYPKIYFYFLDVNIGAPGQKSR